METIRPVLDGVTMLLSFIVVAAVGILNSVAIVCSSSFRPAVLTVKGFSRKRSMSRRISRSFVIAREEER
jgi:hypothetical protein